METGMVDDIVNPSRLSRSQADAICAQCHLQGAVSSSTYGVSGWDFRPGESLARDTTEYQIQGKPVEFRIVGHSEQMYQSGCYLNTETLTCTTCHNPHEHTNKNAASIGQREICISCHEHDACGVPVDIRQTTQQNECAVCHMPRRATNVQHAALHDHRIAVHEQSYLLAQLAVPNQVATRFKSSETPPKLTAIIEDAAVPAWQRDRRWALAMHSLAFSDQLPIVMQGDLLKSQQKLLELFRGGRGDPNSNVTLAKVYLAANQFSSAADLAKRSLEASSDGDHAYVGAADVLAQLALRAEDNKTALHWYQQLTRYRRVSGDHVLLAVCENNAGNRHEAIRALETALEIDPTLLFAHELMVSILDSLGQQDRADAHRKAILSIRMAAAWLPH
jgi:predicted CXXCH cytochrome family protein